MRFLRPRLRFLNAECKSNDANGMASINLNDLAVRIQTVMRAKEQQVSDNRGDNGRDPSDQNFRKFWYKIKGNRKFLETCFEKFRKMGILGKSRSIRQFLLGPSYFRPGNRQSSTCRKLQLLNSISISARLVFLRLRPNDGGERPFHRAGKCMFPRFTR